MSHLLAGVADQCNFLLVLQRFNEVEVKGTQLSLSLRYLPVEHDFDGRGSDGDGNRRHSLYPV
jgi:hypothetical protein